MKTSEKFIIPFFAFSMLLNLAGQEKVQAEAITDEAQHIYQQTFKSVFQVEVLDQASGKRSSFGSGFLIDGQGLVATNYHVVSSLVNKMSQYHLQAITHDGEKLKAEVLGVDIIHDLAVIRLERAVALKTLELGISDFDKGMKIFSMGNPFDYGMTIIEGIYNGIIKEALYKKILFSGSLNPGMSGGPALDHNGKVIGVNVSTQGNEISFLVPVEFLKNLYTKVKARDFQKPGSWDVEIESQLYDQQKAFLSLIINAEWKSTAIYHWKVPGEFTENFKCWGATMDKEKSWVKANSSSCDLYDWIYLQSDVWSGYIKYGYEQLTGKTSNPWRLYNLYPSHFHLLNSDTLNNAGEEDLTNFVCAPSFVLLDNKNFKANFCTRNYKRYPRIFDVYFSLASLDDPDKIFVAEIVAMGVAPADFMPVLRKFMESITWKK